MLKVTPFFPFFFFPLPPKTDCTITRVHKQHYFLDLYLDFSDTEYNLSGNFWQPKNLPDSSPHKPRYRTNQHPTAPATLSAVRPSFHLYLFANSHFFIRLKQQRQDLWLKPGYMFREQFTPRKNCPRILSTASAKPLERSCMSSDKRKKK